MSCPPNSLDVCVILLHKFWEEGREIIDIANVFREKGCSEVWKDFFSRLRKNAEPYINNNGAEEEDEIEGVGEFAFIPSQ